MRASILLAGLALLWLMKAHAANVWNCAEAGADGRSLEPWPNCVALAFVPADKATVVASNGGTADTVRWLAVSKLTAGVRVWSEAQKWEDQSLFTWNITPVPPPVAVTPGTGTAVLSWVPPDKNTDGSVLTNLAGYRLYYGATSTLGQVIDIKVPQTTYVLTGLAAGTWYFQMEAYTVSATSDRSNLVSKVIPAAPSQTCKVKALTGSQDRPAQELVLSQDGKAFVLGYELGRVPLGAACDCAGARSPTDTYHKVTDITWKSPTYVGRTVVALCAKQ